jgi:hypothetical protein
VKQLNNEFLVSLKCGDIFEYAYDYYVNGKDIYICGDGRGCEKAPTHIRNVIFNKIIKNRIKRFANEQ